MILEVASSAVMAGVFGYTIFDKQTRNNTLNQVLKVLGWKIYRISLTNGLRSGYSWKD
jgi:hypothetical protein